MAMLRTRLPAKLQAGELEAPSYLVPVRPAVEAVWREEAALRPARLEGEGRASMATKEPACHGPALLDPDAVVGAWQGGGAGEGKGGGPRAQGRKDGRGRLATGRHSTGGPPRRRGLPPRGAPAGIRQSRERGNAGDSATPASAASHGQLGPGPAWASASNRLRGR
ncbi:uncharacterized protein LOC120701084 [Panicum virgatum]|uniref:uncharacterized protein LOC120701084 n=1 Tax=Panicum virgatum TaxID=38727 RepID=UPI0019D59024|nr:uncharacterized protein LOC120701084 [Panicum virgatum]